MATDPVIYDIRRDQDAARFGLQPWERDYLLTRCIRNRAGYKAGYLFFHIQEGRTVGSMEHFVHGHYADGSKVSASCSVCIQRDGSILRVIPEEHGPWTNGAVRNPTDRGRAPRWGGSWTASRRSPVPAPPGSDG